MQRIRAETDAPYELNRIHQRNREKEFRVRTEEEEKKDILNDRARGF